MPGWLTGPLVCLLFGLLVALDCKLFWYDPEEERLRKERRKAEKARRKAFPRARVVR